MQTNTIIHKMLQGEKVEWHALEDVADLKRGRVLSKPYLEEHKGDYPVYSSQTLFCLWNTMTVAVLCGATV
ncbi:hypothetical protein [Kingella negevensis]|uniref:hypothetical protein n=1 Tax=Kingella negevensis TaxID=1522312 RepID=UPI00050A28A8|nr:hypothetical protein [Kingella negevensis]MDK4688580.1 hypothetical protein [Kingella negevensis]WII91676.1 hypothetical protein QEO93_03595 [Kingella negevensis]